MTVTSWSKYAIIAAAAIGLSNRAVAQPFAPGNLAVLRVGDGVTSVNTANAAPVSILEMTPTGSIVRVIPVNSGASGTRLTQIPGSFGTVEGDLTRSDDGRYLTFAGYDTAAGQQVLPSAARVFGRLDLMTGAVDLSTTVTTNRFIHGAATMNGSRFWSAGSLGAPGLGTQPFGGSGPMTTVNDDVTFLAPRVIDGQLYAVNANTNQVVTTTTPLPTGPSTIEPLLTYPGGAFPTSFAFLDRDGTPGLDTALVAGQNGLATYHRDPPSNPYELENFLATIKFFFITVEQDDNDLFGTNGDGFTANNALQIFTITSGFGDPLTGNLSTIAMAGDNYIFRGVSLGIVPIPEPASMVLGGVGVAAFAIIRRRRRRSADASRCESVAFVQSSLLLQRCTIGEQLQVRQFLFDLAAMIGPQRKRHFQP